MAHILDRILEFNADPKALITTTRPIQDKEVHPTSLGRFVEEDKDAWFVKRNGKYILYCDKHKSSPKDLELLLQETWGRYTRKNLHADLDFGYRV